jgi:hypothetical protein
VVGSRFSISLALITAAALIIALAAGADAQPRAFTVDTSQMRTGVAPRSFGFTVTGDGPVAAWKVVADPTATAEKAIASTSTSTAIGQSYLAVYEPVAAASVEVSAHFKLVGGTAHHAGGIALRLLSPDDYYLVRADPADEDVRLYRVVAGNRREIKQVSTEVAPDQWHTLDVRVEQGRFEVSLDGKSLFTANDQTSSDSGKVALWTESDSETHFDKISITPLD